MGERTVIKVKPFVRRCPHCELKPRTVDLMFQHLRDDHGYPLEDASVESTNGEWNYSSQLRTLKALLERYTDDYTSEVY